MTTTLRRHTIADVAKAAGVSKTAVSFAFNAPDRLGTETVNHIIDVATTLGYRPHPVASSLARRKTGTLAILTPQPLGEIFENPYHALFASGVATAAEAAGYALQFISPLKGSLARAVERASVDGIIAVGLDPSHPEVARIRRYGMRIVLVDAAASELAPSVSIDDEAGAYAAAAHVVGLGHRDVLVLSVEPPAGAGGIPAAVAAERMHGYRRAFAEVGAEITDDQVVDAPTTIEGGHEAFAGAWDDGQRPTAVLAMSDVTALGALHATREYGISVPEDLSIVGFDDIDQASYTNPPLTTIHQPVRRKGEEAVRLLLHPTTDTSRPEHPRLDVRLVIRGSTGPVRRLDRRWPTVDR